MWINGTLERETERERDLIDRLYVQAGGRTGGEKKSYNTTTSHNKLWLQSRVMGEGHSRWIVRRKFSLQNRTLEKTNAAIKGTYFARNSKFCKLSVIYAVQEDPSGLAFNQTMPLDWNQSSIDLCSWELRTGLSTNSLRKFTQRKPSYYATAWRCFIHSYKYTSSLVPCPVDTSKSLCMYKDCRFILIKVLFVPNNW